MQKNIINLNVATRRGTVLNGALFSAPGKADALVIVITGIHGNFYSNPFYYDIGGALNAAGIDFAYAQTRNAFSVIKTRNVLTKNEEVIGSWNERFADTDEDIIAYLDEAERRGYEHIVLAGHSLGANKVIYYLSRHHDPRVEHFILMSPANVDYMTSGVTREEREIVAALMSEGRGSEMLPFPLMGWVDCTVATAADWLGPTLNNVHTSHDGDWSQISRITHTGALLIGTYDRFTDGNPAAFLENINSHFPKADENRLVFIEKTGHTYQQKHREVADAITRLVLGWRGKGHSMKNLFDETKLGGVTLRNRAWRSATWLGLAGRNGEITDGIIRTYTELAKGGVAMLVTGLTSIAEDDSTIGGEVKFYDDLFIVGHRRLTDAVHDEGAKIIMQTAMVDGLVDELTTDEVEGVVRQFGEAAARAERSGYDGVQIHAAHFFYLSKFISPLFNHRNDRFGGSPENRARILVEILTAMRERPRPGFVVAVKINSDDCQPGGLSQTDFLVAGKMLSDAGIDAIEVSANYTSRPNIRPGVNEGSFLPAATALAASVKTPVVLVGGLRSLETINTILAKTEIAYIALSRPLIRDPNLINRWRAGDVLPSACVSCNACYRTNGHVCAFTSP